MRVSIERDSHDCGAIALCLRPSRRTFQGSLALLKGRRPRFLGLCLLECVVQLREFIVDLWPVR